MQVSGQLHAPAALPQGKQLLVLTAQDGGWPPEQVWMSSVVSAENRTTVVQPLA
jgi:hypothetical protein